MNFQNRPFTYNYNFERDQGKSEPRRMVPVEGSLRTSYSTQLYGVRTSVNKFDSKSAAPIKSRFKSREVVRRCSGPYGRSRIYALSSPDMVELAGNTENSDEPTNNKLIPSFVRVSCFNSFAQCFRNFSFSSVGKFFFLFHRTN